MKRISMCVLTGLFFVVSMPAYAQPTFFGKTVTIVVGYGAGGGYDRMARLVAKYLPGYLPGAAGVAVRNMPGVNSIIAANYVYNIARPDGLTMGLFDRNLILAQLLKVEGIQFDMARFAWIGSTSSETTVLVVRADLPVKTFEDLRRAQEPVVIGATGPGSGSYDFPVLLKAFLKAPLRIVSGYPSSADIMRAIVRKEVDGRAGSYSSLKPFIDAGMVRPLIRARTSVPEIAGLPVDEDLASDARVRNVMALRSSPEVAGRAFAAPPDTPSEAVNVLTEAFAKVTKDRAFLAEASQAGFVIDFVPGEEFLKIVRQVLSAPPDVVRIFSQIFKFAE